MVKTLRVSESTYALVMEKVSEVQAVEKRHVTVDEALRKMLLKKKRIDPLAWEKLEKLRFSGLKEDSTEMIDLVQ